MTNHLYSLALLGVLAAGAGAQTPTAPTPGQAHVDFYRGNIGHTGVSTESLTTPLSLLWRHTTTSARNNPASPVYASGTAYFTSGGFLYAINAADGTTRWQYPQGKAASYFATTPALAGGALFLTDDNGQAYRLDAATGQQTWVRKLDGAIRSAPIVSGGVVYFGSGNSHCYALNADTGQVIWDVAADGPVSASPTVTGGLVVFASSDDNVYSLNARTGRKAWAAPFDADPSTAAPIFDGTTLYVTSGDTIYRLDPSNAGRRGPIKLPTNVLLPPTISGDSLYVITQSNALYALTSGGRERWRVILDAAATAPPLLAGGLLIVTTQTGVLSGYDAATGKLTWRYSVQASATDSQPKYPTASINAAPIVADGTLYVVSDDGSLSAFRADAPDDIKPQLTQLVPEAGAVVRSANLTYGALLVDDGTGINPSSVSVSVDGQADARALYHAGQNAVYNTPTTPLKEGVHQITVKAADWRGNALAQTWSFTVQDRAREPSPGFNPNNPNYPGAGGRSPNAPPPPPPISPF